MNQRPRAYEALDPLRLLNSLSVTEVSELSKFSKAYISQVRNGKRPPSKRLLKILASHRRSTSTEFDYYDLFITSRRAIEVSPGTLQFYRIKLGRFLLEVNVDEGTRGDIEIFLLQFQNPGNRHAYYRAIRTFYKWREETFDLPSPIEKLKAPKLGKPILPSLSRDEVLTLIESTANVRDKAIIGLFVESGLRLSELASIEPNDINWDERTIRIIGKGNKEALAPFGKMAEKHLKNWLSIHKPESNIWGLNAWGIISMLRRLEATTGIQCNPHTFRRTFACLLRKAGLDMLTMKDLGRWESVDMVQRYTLSIDFNDCLTFYRKVFS